MSFFCRCFQLKPSPCCCLNYSRMSLSAALVAAVWGLGAAGAVVAVEVEAAAERESAGLAGNRRGWMWRYSQLNHNWSS